MQWAHAASGYLAISQLVFLTCLYLIYFPRHLLSRLIALFCLCAIAYIVVSSAEIPMGILRYTLTTLATLAPALLWVIARYLFEDHPRIHYGMWALVAFYVLLRLVGLFVWEESQGRGNLTFLVHFYVPQLIMLFLVCHVVYMACRGRDSDLVEPRRQLRMPFAIGMGIIVGLIVASGFFQENHLLLDSVYFTGMFLLVLGINLGMFRIDGNSQLMQTAGEQPAPLPPPAFSRLLTAADEDIQVSRPNGGVLASVPEATPGKGPAHPVPSDVSRQDQVLIDRVLRAMKDERLYAEAGMTIGDLAARVSLQEYRLRRLINQILHYRNFNQFLNHYRIEEAARRLLDPEEEHLPISSIALDVGYMSLSSFNKAFKDTHGVTPSVYRGGHHASAS